MTGSLTHALFQTIASLARAVEVRDLYTSGHHQRTSELARRIAQTLGLDAEAVEGIRLGSTLHDIGKIGVPFEVLAKPARLTHKEMEIVREHVAIGAEVLVLVDFPWPILSIVRQHHERLDGSGYPEGLRGDAITLEARIVAVADSVDSMMSNRPYRSKQVVSWVVEELENCRGRLYDPDVVDACVQVITHPDYRHGEIGAPPPQVSSGGSRPH